jgi:hypothetical protein
VQSRAEIQTAREAANSMTTMPRQYMIATSHGDIAVEDCGHGEVPTLLIHGNSSCREVFRN